MDRNSGDFFSSRAFVGPKKRKIAIGDAEYKYLTPKLSKNFLIHKVIKYNPEKKMNTE